MEFWNGNPASPTLWTAYGFGSRAPDYLRKGPPPPVHNAWRLPDGRIGSVRRCYGTDCVRVGEFLEANYGGADWRLADVASWIHAYLADSAVICLGMYDNSGGLVATIFSVPLGGTTHMSHGAILENVRVIEGLCVLPAYRGAGLAGVMIAHIDSLTYKLYKDTVHLWSRELPFSPPLSTALCVDTYAYRTCDREATADRNLQSVAWSEFAESWKKSCIMWPGKLIVAEAPVNRRGDLRVYKYKGQVVVIADTRRATLDGQRIYEVVWCGTTTEPHIFPGSMPDLSFKQALDACAAALGAAGPGLLFAGSSPAVGGAESGWEGWTYGRSGAHATYIYNYMPPEFGSCRIYAIREEL